MLPYLIAGAIGFVVAKLFEEDEAPKYADGGSVLLAPNGKPSNLNPEQYKLVRTPEFKAWFGDWENDPETASKVIDENVEPLVVYRGVHEKQRNLTGFWLTKSKSYAENYGEVNEYFVNIRKPMAEELFDKTWMVDYEKYDGRLGDFHKIVVKTINQIKIADGTNTTFDGNNPDIRFDGGGSTNEEELIIEELKKNELLKNYLTGQFIGKDNKELYDSLKKYLPLKNKYPKIFKPKSKIFYRTDTILRTPQLEYEIINKGVSQRKLPLIEHLSHFSADLLENVTYEPKNKLQGWTSDKDFVFEHWYNVYVMGQGGDYDFDEEKYFSCVYVLKDTTDLLFNEIFLDELRSYFNGNGDESESLRLGNEVVCDVIILYSDDLESIEEEDYE
jgi:hypothetical protein